MLGEPPFISTSLANVAINQSVKAVPNLIAPTD
jgi:hypothetical protein